MTSDFIFIEEQEGAPIIDGISPSRLESEWCGIKIELESPQIEITPKLWENLINIYKSLCIQEPEQSVRLLQSFISDLAAIITNAFYSKEFPITMTLFFDLLKLNYQPLVALQKESLLPFLRLLPQICISCEAATIDFLDVALDPYCADDIFDEDSSRPFVDFLIEGFCSFSPISSKIRSVIETLIKDGTRDSLPYFFPKFIHAAIQIMQQMTAISPTIFVDSNVTHLLKWVTDTIYITHDSSLIGQFQNLFVDTVLNPLSSQTDLIAISASTALMSGISAYPCLSLFINKLLDPNDFFLSKLNDWVNSYQQQLLYLVRDMISIRCSAIMNAFFYLPSMDHNSNFYSFPSIPIAYCKDELGSFPSPESYHAFSQFNYELPNFCPHQSSLLVFLDNFYSLFWQLTPEIANILTDTIERLAGSNTPQAYYFCFTPGMYIFAHTARHLQRVDTTNLELRKILFRFVTIMSRILSQYQQPHR